MAKLDNSANDKAQAALKQLQGGADFGTLASQVSDDLATKGNGGQYPASITPSNTDLPPAIVAQIFKLQPGSVSAIINTGYTLDIVKVTGASGNSRQAAHIQFTLVPINTYTKPLQAKQPSKQYIKF